MRIPLRKKTVDEIAEYMDRCSHDPGGSDILEKKGISQKTGCIAGYDRISKSVVIPTNTGYVLYDENGACRFPDDIRPGIYGIENLKGEEPVFVTMSAIDGLAIADQGYAVISLNTVDTVETFIDTLKQPATSPHCILCINDKGILETLRTAFNVLKRAYSEKPFAIKSPVDFLNSDKSGFQSVLHSEIYKVKHPDPSNDKDSKGAEVVKPYQKYHENLASQHLTDYIHYVVDGGGTNCVPTGFTYFDKVIGGGLFPKMYCIGAMPTVGKTTFVMQIADNLARRGVDVMTFNLEMSHIDLIAKSVSRLTYDPKHPENARGELFVTSRNLWTESDKKNIIAAMQTYASFANHLSIYEGAMTVSDIYDRVREYMEITGKTPVVIIDYLQIIAPLRDNMSAKESVDTNVAVLLQMRREFKTPMIVISSFNRTSYTGVADMSAFKESGGIEYSADAALIMELGDVKHFSAGGKDATTNKVKVQNDAAMEGKDGIRNIKISFVKNRGNPVGKATKYAYRPEFNHFTEYPGIFSASKDTLESVNQSLNSKPRGGRGKKSYSE